MTAGHGGSSLAGSEGWKLPQIGHPSETNHYKHRSVWQSLPTMAQHDGAPWCCSTGNGRNQKLTHHHRINQCHWTPSRQSTVLDQVASCSVPKQMTFKGGNKDHHNQNQGNHHVHGQCHGDSEKRNPQRSAGTAAPAGRCWARGCSKPPTSYGCKNISHLGWLFPIYGTIQFMFHAL